MWINKGLQHPHEDTIVTKGASKLLSKGTQNSHDYQENYIRKTCCTFRLQPLESFNSRTVNLFPEFHALIDNDYFFSSVGVDQVIVKPKFLIDKIFAITKILIENFFVQSSNEFPIRQLIY